MTAVPLTTHPVSASPGVLLVRRVLRDSGYVLLGLPLALAGFVLAVTGISLTATLLLTVVGLPVLAGTLYAARGLADLERRLLSTVLRHSRVRPGYLFAEPRAGFWRRVLTPMRDPQSWLDLLHACVKPLVALPTVAVVMTWWVGGLVGTFSVTYDWALPPSPESQSLSQLLGMGDGGAARIAVNTAIGVLFLLTLPVVARACALLQAGLARSLLTGMAEMRHRITTLEDQRRAAASAEASALRRLERDLHDGPQQRLVRLAMDLSRARQQLGTDTEAAGRTLDEAVTQARETLDELRALSRGIAPPILLDRGLPSALAALAARALVPTELVIDDDLGMPAGRLDPAVESTAYFVVAEALTNVAKHSGGTACRVEVAAHVGRLEVIVWDDGAGGAHLAKGHGLSGIADRLRAIGATLEVSSPGGGPTTVRAEIPR